jgi:2-hydroxy-3-keto-5-methylthiopentenyl-1-phosphate phosphatase
MNETKSEKITTKFTPSERTKIEKHASDNNMSLSEYVRQRLLGDVVRNEEPAIEKLLKCVSVCTAFAQTFAEKKFNDEEIEKYADELERILEKNGVSEIGSDS